MYIFKYEKKTKSNLSYAQQLGRVFSETQNQKYDLEQLS